MTTLTIQEPTKQNNDLPSMIHWFCKICDDDIALCGTYKPGRAWLPDDGGEADCVVCESMVDQPCPKCGTP